MFEDDIPVFLKAKKPELPPKRQPWEMDIVEQMLRQGKKVSEIAKELNRNPSTIYRWLWGGRKAKNKIKELNND